MPYISKKINYNLFGGGFQHSHGTTLNKIPSYINWDYNSSKNEISFFIDDAIIYDLNLQTKNYGWLLESKFISPDSVKFCIDNSKMLMKKYINIFTHNEELLNLDPDFFLFAPANGTWIENIYIRNKTKLISMITSNKLITVGHKKRLEIANKFKNNLDLYGRGFNEIQNKEEALDDYMFSIVVENGLYDTYFTEKILDCFATGTIPIYLGTHKISKFFNPDGIIFYDKNFDIHALSEDLYFSKIKAVKDNIEIVKKFNIAEDWLYEKYFME